MVQGFCTAPVAEEGLSGDLTFAEPKGPMDPDVLLGDDGCFDHGVGRGEGQERSWSSQEKTKFFSRHSFRCFIPFINRVCVRRGTGIQN